MPEPTPPQHIDLVSAPRMDEIESLLSEIAAGKDTSLEIKEVVFKDNQVRFAREEGKAQPPLAEVFVSLANTEGGVIVLGVNDNREVVGIDETKRDILEQFVVNICLNNCAPGIEPLLDWLYLPDPQGRPVLCLKVTIPKARFYVHSTSDGRYLKRVGSHQTLIPGAFIDVAAYAGTIADGTTTDSRRLFGPVPEQIEQMLRYFRTSPLVAHPSRKDAEGRLDQETYSLLALQEGLVNAVVHRDYEIEGSQVRVFLFLDRIEIWNPGGLHNSLTPEDLFQGCQPIRRNQLLAGFMRDYTSPMTGRSYMESRGEGFLSLVRESERISGRRPELDVIGRAVRLTIFAAPDLP